MEDKTFIITSGTAYTDVDALACSIAYHEVLKSLGKKSFVVLPGPLNETISKTMRVWPLPFETNFLAVEDNYHFIMVDISDPTHFPPFVILGNIIEIVDHHYGYQDYWEKRLGKKSKIEPVGACATLIWKTYKDYKKEAMITPISANLLYTAIISNTLNFKASVTTKSDIISANELLPYTTLSKNWIEKYYGEVEQRILFNIPEAIKNDTKKIVVNQKIYIISQIELWSAAKLIQKLDFLMLTLVKEYLNLETYNNVQYQWFLNILDIQDGVNYLLTDDINTQQDLQDIFQINFIKNTATTNKLILRKEIIKKLILKAENNSGS